MFPTLHVKFIEKFKNTKYFKPNISRIAILKLMRSTIVVLDKPKEYTCAGALQRVCCQATKKEHIPGFKNLV